MYRIVKFGRFVLFFSVFVISKSYGQAVSSTQKAPDNQPKVVVSFREAEPIHIPEISPVMATPMQCTDRGAFVGMLQPPQYQKELLLSISLSGNRDIRAFRTEQISDLFDIQKLGYFAANSSVAMLVYASRENKHGEQTITTSSGDSSQRTGNTGEHHYYIVWFDNDGKYQKFTQIEDAFDRIQLQHFHPVIC